MKAWPKWFEQSLAETEFLQTYPQYVSVVSRMLPIHAKAIHSMAVGLARPDQPNGDLILYVNRDYFEKEPAYWLGIFLHEIHHVVHGHLTSARLHAVEHPRAMEVAMEVSANEFIAAFVPRPYEWKNFKKHGLRPLQSTLERYELLAVAEAEGRLKLPRGKGFLDNHRLPSMDGVTGIGNAIDMRSTPMRRITWQGGLGLPTPPHVIEHMKALIREYIHEPGGQGSQEPTTQIARDETRRMITSTGDRLDWASIVERVFRRNRVTTSTYLRPNRRFPDRLGEIPGRMRRPPRPRLLVGVDTSASIPAETLGDMFRHLDALAQVAQLTIVECDAAIHRVYPLATRPTLVHGGGDTDFAPVFDPALIRREQAAGVFSGIVYFTDGKGSFPSSPPSLPTLWALTNQDPFLCPWGTQVQLPMRQDFGSVED